MDMDILVISVFSLVVDGCPAAITVFSAYAMHNCFTIYVTDIIVSAFLFYLTIWFVHCRIRFLSLKLNIYFGNYLALSILPQFLHTIFILCSLSSKHLPRVIPLRSLLQQCRNICNSLNYYYLGVSDFFSL